MSTLAVSTFDPRASDMLSIPFCLQSLVDSANVSALTDPDDVIVGKDIPVPAATLNTVPPPDDDMSRARLSATFFSLTRVDICPVSASSVPVVVMGPPIRPKPVDTFVTVPTLQVLFALRSNVVPLMVRVRVLGTRRPIR